MTELGYILVVEIQHGNEDYYKLQPLGIVFDTIKDAFEYAYTTEVPGRTWPVREERIGEDRYNLIFTKPNDPDYEYCMYFQTIPLVPYRPT